MKKDYDAICSAVPEFSRIASLDDFMRMRTLVNSRIFGIKIDGEENDSVVPFADMFNYKYRSNMTYWSYDELNEGFVVRTKENVKAGQEIYVYYGNKPNSSFFLFYGFVVEDNVNDDVTLVSPKGFDFPLSQLKRELVGTRFKESCFRVSRNPDDSKFQKFLSYLRFLVFDESPEKLKFLVETVPETRKLALSFVSVENEKKALDLLANLCRDQLKSYPTTIEEDQKLLEKSNLTYNQRNCILFRASEKCTLNLLTQAAHKGLRVLEGEPLTEENSKTRYYVELKHAVDYNEMPN